MRNLDKFIEAFGDKKVSRKQAKNCNNYLPPFHCSDDKGIATCIAHIGSARVFDCHIDRDGKGKCSNHEIDLTNKNKV